MNIRRQDSRSTSLIARFLVTTALALPIGLAGGAVAQAAPVGASSATTAQQAAAKAKAERFARHQARAARLAKAKLKAKAERFQRHKAQQARVAKAKARAKAARIAAAKARAAAALAAAEAAEAARIAEAQTAPASTDLTPVSPVAVSDPAVAVALVEAPVESAPVVDLTALPASSPGPWKRVFADDFATDVPLGGFLSSEYKNRWMSYDGFGDTSGVGRYEPNKVLSVKNGSLDMYLHTENGVPLGAAPVPLVNGRWPGQVYGRFSVRFRADSLAGFGNGWLLWPNSNNWDEGELDFAEGALDGTVNAYGHCVGNPRNNCLVAETKERWNTWHVATVEWLPTGVTFLLDGTVIGVSKSVPTTKMHMVLQTATTGVKPAADTAGHVQIDWVTIDEYVA